MPTTLSDSLVLRTVKGAPLTNAEGDNNLVIIRDFVNAMAAQLGGSVNEDGTISNPLVVSGTSATGTDSYETTLDYTPASEADLAGKIILLKPTDVGNVGVATLKVAPLATARTIVRAGGVALHSGDLRVNHSSALLWDAANTWFELLNPCTNGRINYYADSGGAANTVVLATSPTLPFAEPGALYAGYQVKVLILNTNTGATTLKIGGLDAAAVTKFGTVPLAGGELVAGQIAEFLYDGANFQVQGLGNRVTTSSDFALTNANAAVLAATSHNLGGNPSNLKVFFVNKANNGVSGYAPGDLIEAEQVVQYDSAGTGFVLPTRNVNVWANATQYGINSAACSFNLAVPKKAGTGVIVTSVANFILDWNVRVVLLR